MNSAEFVVKVGNPYFPVLDTLESSENLLNSAIKYAVAKKAFPLFYEGCLKNQLQLPREADVLMGYYRRHRAKQIEAAKLLMDIHDKFGVDLMFFKTFRPFDYIPDDVDVLLYDEKSLNLLVNELKNEGYFILKVGTPEIVLRKVEKGNYVDLDIHKRLAVGSLDLFEVKSLWRKHSYEIIELGDGYEAPKLSEDYEVVREAAYSLLKDFNLSISGLYLGINAMMNRNLAVIEKIAVEENFPMHLHLYLDIVYYLACKLFGIEAKIKLRYENKDAPAALMKLCRNIRVPYPYPITAITWAYTSKVWLEIRRNKNLEILPKLIKQPSSKGVGLIMDYLKEYLH